MSNITLNIVAPDTPTPTPVDPVAPNTGLFTHGIGSSEATIIAVSTILLLAIVALVVFAILHKKKTGKSLIRNNKHITTAVILLAILTSAGTFIALARNAALAADTDEDTNDETGLTVDVSSTEFTIELADQPVFAVLPVDVTVEEATDLGYTLTAYTDNTSLVSTTDSSKVIPMVTVDAEDVEDIDEEASEEEPLDSSLVPLSPNTYGLSFTDPESALDEVFTSLSTDSTTPTFITDKDYEATLENDTTTIYYGFYITPDTPYGTYTGSTISYEAIPNLATITYNAAGLYYDNDESFTTNTVGYKPSTPEAPIEEVVGEYLTPAPLTPVDPSTTIHYTFLGWSETEGATTPTYTNEEDILANLTLTKNESLTLYAVWHYDTVLSFNGTTSDGGEAIEQQTIPAGTTITLPHNTYTRTGSVFTGWNTVETPTPDNPGKSYEDEAEFTVPEESADITLYAQWAYYTTITFNGNGETSGSMADQVIVAGTPQNLTPNAFTKEGYVFASWNTEKSPTPDNPGTVYADKAQYAAGITQPESITLYAQWKVPTLYDKVAAMSKGTQTLSQLQEDISAPTTDDPSTDQSNSGVYEYNSSVFGEASDASNANKIYYYRGVLEPEADQGSYGSDGKATTYPNYVRLGNNTCWRIVRTTGSGGVKMVYNGTWTGATCANSKTNAQVFTQAFASKGTSSQSPLNWYKNIHYVGYTFNNNVTDSTAGTPVDTVFGSDANPSLNNTRSNIKTYIEDTWYASNMTDYTNLLEPAAGYCNDRTAYSDDTTTTALSTIAPYITSNATMYFGAYGRNYNATNAGKTPSLTCPRSTVDLYRYVPNSEGTSNELKYPAALLTADEVSLAGSGSSTASQGSSYNKKSYLCSGGNFWLLSPAIRDSAGDAYEFDLFSYGILARNDVHLAYGVRPSISLSHETTVNSGTGTATDPWAINE